MLLAHTTQAIGFQLSFCSHIRASWEGATTRSKFLSCQAESRRQGYHHRVVRPSQALGAICTGPFPVIRPLPASL